MVSLICLVAAAAGGLAAGWSQGGDTDLVFGATRGFAPDMAAFAAAGLSGFLLCNVLDLEGTFGGTVTIASTTALVWFVLANLRVGGAVVVALGLGLNDLVAILNGGTPRSVNLSATTRGARVSGDGALLGWLGEVIPGPFHVAWSIGDILIAIGVALVAFSLSMHRIIVSPRSYESMISALGQGPAPRRGPGMHPTRRAEQLTTRRSEDSLVRVLDEEPYH